MKMVKTMMSMILVTGLWVQFTWGPPPVPPVKGCTPHYNIYRQVDSGPVMLFAQTSKLTFTDDLIPQSFTTLTYWATAVCNRSESVKTQPVVVTPALWNN